MINDMIKPFKEAVLKDEGIILDNYKLKDGIYVLFDINKDVEVNENNYMIINSKSKEDETVKIKKPELFKLLREMDYNSVILNDDTNKAVDLPAKKIHSTNFMTLFLKKDICPGIGKKPIEKGKLLKLIDGYFNKLKTSDQKFFEIYEKSNFTKGKLKKNQKEEFLKNYFEKYIDYMRNEKRLQNIERNKKFILNNFDNIIEEIKKIDSKNNFNGYIKIFTDYDIEIYKMENDIYTIPRIFNVNDYNIFIGRDIYGLSSSNMTANSKKPYLLMRTMKCAAPYRAEIKDVEYTKMFFDWLISKGKFKEIKFDYQHEDKDNKMISHKKGQPYLSINIDQNAQIQDFDNVPFDRKEFRFEFKNVLGLKTKINKDDKDSPKVLERMPEIKDYDGLKQNFSYYFFNDRFLDYSPGVSEVKIKANVFTGRMKALYIISRNALYDFFNKGIKISVNSIMDRLTMELIIENLKNTVQGLDVEHVARAYNLRISILTNFEFGGNDMGDKIKKIADDLRSKLDLKQLVICESDNEFYYMAGQIAYYILSQSKASQKTFGTFEPIIDSKNATQLKKKIRNILSAYDYAISIGNIRFKNAVGMIMGYDPEENITDEGQGMLLAGIMANNLFYEKKEE